MTFTRQDWQEVRLGQIADFRNGVNYTQDNFGRGVKVINVKDFQDYTSPKYETLDEINPDGVVREAHLLRENDVIFVRSNGNRELIGRSLALLALPSEPVTHSAFTIRARMNTQPELNSRFYAYVFRSGVIRQVLSAQGNGANISNLNQDILDRLIVPLPPRQQQDRIAAILSAYDDLIENNTRRIAILEEMARRLYEEWFVHFRFPANSTTTVASEKLLDLAAVAYGKGLPSKSLIPDGDYPVYGAAKIIGRYNTFTEKGRTIIAGCRGSVGRFTITEPTCFVTNNSFTFKPKDNSDFYWLFYALSNRGLEDVVGGSAQPQITLASLSNVDLPVPTAADRERFAGIVRPWMAAIWNYQARKANLRAQRDLLLPKLVSGEIDVSDAEAALEAAE